MSDQQETQTQFKQNLKSRKLIGAVVLFIASTVFLSIGMADFTQWSSFNQWLFGIYVVGNIGEHAKSAIETGIKNGTKKA